MPPKGYVSITVPEEFYLKIQKEYNRNEKILARIGIHSMTGFYTSLVVTLMSDDGLYNLALQKLSEDVVDSLKDMRKK